MWPLVTSAYMHMNLACEYQNYVKDGSPDPLKHAELHQVFSYRLEQRSDQAEIILLMCIAINILSYNLPPVGRHTQSQWICLFLTSRNAY